jgi:hypothetical protein
MDSGLWKIASAQQPIQFFSTVKIFGSGQRVSGSTPSKVTTERRSYTEAMQELSFLLHLLCGFYEAAEKSILNFAFTPCVSVSPR